VTALKPQLRPIRRDAAGKRGRQALVVDRQTNERKSFDTPQPPPRRQLPDFGHLPISLTSPVQIPRAPLVDGQGDLTAKVCSTSGREQRTTETNREDDQGYQDWFVVNVLTSPTPRQSGQRKPIPASPGGLSNPLRRTLLHATSESDQPVVNLPIVSGRDRVSVQSRCLRLTILVEKIWDVGLRTAKPARAKPGFDRPRHEQSRTSRRHAHPDS